MPFAIKSDTSARDLVALGSRNLTERMLGNYVADFARAAFEEIDRENLAALGKNVAVKVTVDGRSNVPLESVKPAAGVIEFEWQMVDDVLHWIWQALKDRSPVNSGGYRDSHVLLADGAQVNPEATIPPAARFVFANSEPYARRLEIGKTESGRDFVVQVANHIYERTAKDAAARFGNQAHIEFGFYQLEGAYQLHRNQRSRAFSSGRRYTAPGIRSDRTSGRSVPSPAIIVELSSGQQAAGRQLVGQQQAAKQLQDFSNG